MAETEKQTTGVSRYNQSGTNALGKELNKDLQGIKKYPIFDMMGADAIIASLFEMIRSTIAGATWEIVGGTPEQNEFCASWFGRNQNDFLRAATLYLKYGSYAFEQVQIAVSMNIGGVERIAIVDDCQPRQPHTFLQFVRDRAGRLEKIVQTSPNGAGEIFVDRMVFLVNDSEMMQNLEGDSLLRPAYPGWKLKNEHRLQDLFGAQRWANGTLDIVMAPNASDAAKKEADTLGRRFSSGSNTWIVRSKSANIAEINIIQATGQPYNAEPKAESFNKEMAQAFLAHFMTLNAGSLGGAAELVAEFVERFYAFTESKAQYMADIFTTQRLHRLVRWNFADANKADMPRIVVSGINKISGDQLAKFINLIQPILPPGFFTPTDYSIIKRHAGLTDFEVAGTAETKTELNQRKAAACGCGKRHDLSQVKPAPRALSPLESHVAFDEITAELDTANEDLKKRLLEILNKAGASYMAWALPIIQKGEAAELSKIKPRYIAELKTAMVGVVNRMIERGASDVYAEYKKQTGDGVRQRAVQFDTGMARLTKQRAAAIKALIEQRAENMASAAADAVTTTGLTLVGNLVVDESDIAAALVAAFGQRAAALINDLATTLPPTAYQVGRADAAAELESKKVFYSAVMDARTCEPCASVDGSEVINGLPAAPNPACDGLARCRCIHVYEF